MAPAAYFLQGNAWSALAIVDTLRVALGLRASGRSTPGRYLAPPDSLRRGLTASLGTGVGGTRNCTRVVRPPREWHGLFYATRLATCVRRACTSGLSCVLTERQGLM